MNAAHQNERSCLFIQPRQKTSSIHQHFPFLDTTATNERTPDSTSMTHGRERNFPHTRTHTFANTHFQSLLSLLLLVCDLYIRRILFFSSSLLPSRIGFLTRDYVLSRAREWTHSHFCSSVHQNYESRHLIFLPLSLEKRAFGFGLGVRWWLGCMVGPGRKILACIGARASNGDGKHHRGILLPILVTTNLKLPSTTSTSCTTVAGERPTARLHVSGMM